jgi:hypothetical protein
MVLNRSFKIIQKFEQKPLPFNAKILEQRNSENFNQMITLTMISLNLYNKKHEDIQQRQICLKY